MKSRFYQIVGTVFVFTLIIDFLTAMIIWSFHSILIVHGLLALVFYVFLFQLLSNRGNFRENILRNKHYPASGMLVLFYLPKLILVVFHLAEETILLLYKGIALLLPSLPQPIQPFYFLTAIGAVLGVIVFIGILFGIVWGKFLYQVKHVHLSFKDFPKKLNELKLIQISDFHIGSFRNHKRQFERAMKMINDLQPDIICFTGDLVNMFAEEAESFVPALQNLKARYGKFAILGNHDYGEYYPWDTEREWRENMDGIKNYIEQSGFTLLLNDIKNIENEGEHIVLGGVENWGLPPFPQYGDLKETMKNIKQDEFVILLSHDPSHWDAEIQKYPNIYLTLSGHTHAMQFGIGLKKRIWSPVKWKYKRWAGLYALNNQHLYVNKGLGFIGFPGRVGMYPEITVFHLTREQAS